jgi:hypothetical protein
MNEALFQNLTAACNGEDPREDRARAAAGVIAEARYSWSAIYEIDDDRVTVLGQSGTASKPFSVSLESLASNAFLLAEGGAIVPIFGAESGIPIGALAVERDRSEPIDDRERGVLERCAAIVIALFE